MGSCSLYNNTTGACNVALGFSALITNTTGCRITAVGLCSLYNNTTGCFITAVGDVALRGNTTGSCNVAIGTSSLLSNTSGSDNTSVGFNSLLLNTTGNCNTAIGCGALDANTTGYSNTAVGRHSLGANTTGFENTVVGENAGDTITTGSNLTVLGHNAEPSSATATNEITLGDTNVTIVRNQGSILFPQSGRGIYLGVTTATASNLLDDYEEGDWTPAWSAQGTAPSVTHAAQNGSYTKIGRLVIAKGQVATNASGISGGSGTLIITGLPFTSALESDNGTSAIGFVSWISLNTNYTSFGLDVSSNSTFLRVLQSGSNNSGLTVPVGNASSSQQVNIGFTAVYFTA